MTQSFGEPQRLSKHTSLFLRAAVKVAKRQQEVAQESKADSEEVPLLQAKVVETLVANVSQGTSRRRKIIDAYKRFLTIEAANSAVETTLKLIACVYGLVAYAAASWAAAQAGYHWSAQIVFGLGGCVAMAAASWPAEEVQASTLKEEEAPSDPAARARNRAWLDRLKAARLAREAERGEQVNTTAPTAASAIEARTCVSVTKDTALAAACAIASCQKAVTERINNAGAQFGRWLMSFSCCIAIMRYIAPLLQAIMCFTALMDFEKLLVSPPARAMAFALAVFSSVIPLLDTVCSTQ